MAEVHHRLNQRGKRRRSHLRVSCQAKSVKKIQFQGNDAKGNVKKVTWCYDKLSYLSNRENCNPTRNDHITYSISYYIERISWKNWICDLSLGLGTLPT